MPIGQNLTQPTQPTSLNLNLNSGSNPNSGSSAFPSSGSPNDLFRFLAQYTFNRSQNVPAPVGVDPAALSAIQKFLDNQNTAEGLSPEAMTALQRESTAGLQDRYNTAASSLRTQLLQRGMYGGAVPANPGALLDSFGPLQSSLAQAQSKAGADAILANEQQKQASLLANRQLAANAVGMSTNITNSANAANLGAYNAGTNELNSVLSAVGTMGELEPTSMRNVILASLIGSGSKLLSDPKAMKSILDGIKGTSTSAATPAISAGTNPYDLTPEALSENAGAGGAPGSQFYNPQTGQIETVPGNQVQDTPGSIATIAGPVAAAGVGAAGAGLAAGSSAAALTPAVSVVIPGVTGAAAAIGGGAAATGAGAEAGAAATEAGATTAAGGGLGSSLAALATNPITWGIAGAIAAGIIWHKSQVHPQANTFVQQFQNPFGQHLSSIVNQFDQALASGQLSKSDAQKARDETSALIQAFEADRNKFSTQGSHEKIVADQAKASMEQYFGRNYAAILGKMDQEITGLQ